MFGGSARAPHEGFFEGECCLLFSSFPGSNPKPPKPENHKQPFPGKS